MAKLLRITGLVQGVGYRASFAAQAQHLGLQGWVRNRRDGSVEACVRGELRALENIIAWARRGPPGAGVQEVMISEVANDMAPGDSFEIAPTR